MKSLNARHEDLGTCCVFLVGFSDLVAEVLAVDCSSWDVSGKDHA